jgi:hypothetical protein
MCTDFMTLEEWEASQATGVPSRTTKALTALGWLLLVIAFCAALRGMGQ